MHNITIIDRAFGKEGGTAEWHSRRAEWRNGGMVERWKGGRTEGKKGGTAEWHGRRAEWWKGGRAVQLHTEST